MIRAFVQRNRYMDSIFLMNLTKRIMGMPGVANAVAVMGTDMNKTVLSEFGALTPETSAATPNDLVLALDLSDEAAADAVISLLDSLKGEMEERPAGKDPGEAAGESYPSLRQASAALPEANLAVISVPGDYAGQEALAAISRGLNVFIFSDNVPLDEEVELKRAAEARGLLAMGPGCGTSVINGISLGVMSRIRAGRIGVVGASGSGIHEICVQIHRAGLGVSQAIGTGGRDISKEVGASTMLRGIRFLDSSPETDVIVLVSKPPHPETMAKVLGQVKTCSKPVVVFFLGGDKRRVEASGALCAESLEHAAEMAISLAKGSKVESSSYVERCRASLEALAKAERAKLLPGQRYLRALFCGGTHSEEAVLLLQDRIAPLHSNLGFGKVVRLENRTISLGNSLVDMGDEEFTRGRPHPVIDPSILNDRLLKEGADPEVGVILFDLLFGQGIHRDPVGAIEESIGTIREEGRRSGRYISIIASLCGTDLDLQDLADQERRLAGLGVIVAGSNAKAAILAGMILE